MSRITTHVLDTARGQPAAGVAVALERRDGDRWQAVGAGRTDDDGRLGTLTDGIALAVGAWRISFAVGEWYAARGEMGFYPEVAIAFTVADADQHYHVPLLISPYGYSTYRGS